MHITFSVVLATAILLPNVLLAGDGYEDHGYLLNAKKRFAENEIRAIAEPFVGVRAGTGIEPDLFSIRSTGVSTKPVVDAARVFLSTLTDAQHVRTVFSVDDPEWRRWCNVDNGIYVRQGVSLKAMTETQREAAMDLMRASLSAKGIELSEAIRKTDHTLREINDSALEYDEDLYFFTFMGLPSESEPWGWQIDGHHLIINYFVLGDQVVMTPAFLGGEPTVTTTGKYKGNSIFQEEQDAGLAFYRMLDTSRQRKALLTEAKPRDNARAQAFKDNLVLEYEGVSASQLSDQERERLVHLMSLYVNHLREGHAKVWMQEIEAHLDQTWFAWIGGASDEDVFYYRIHSPVVLIEFDHQRPVGTRALHPGRKPTRDHIHVVVRTPNGNDYGKDLLRRHLETHPH